MDTQLLCVFIIIFLRTGSGWCFDYAGERGPFHWNEASVRFFFVVFFLLDLVKVAKFKKGLIRLQTQTS